MEPREIERLRKQMGLSVSALAEELGVHKVTVYRWLSGEYSMPEPAVRLMRILARQKVRKGAA